MEKADVIRDNVKKAIKLSGESRYKIAEQAGLSYASITRFLNNNRGGDLSVSTLQKLSDALNVPVSYLLGDTDMVGEYVFTSDGVRLPEEWDEVIKTVLNLPQAEQKKIYSVLKALIG